jgi:AcrR family transcriptional regulator
VAVGNAKRWERRKEARPTELIAAALDLFVERGFKATRLDDVAARAGVTKGTLYLYFKNKEDLLAAVIRENVLPNLARVEHLVETHEGPTGALIRQIVHFWWDNVGSTRIGGLPKLIFSEAANFPELAQIFMEVFTRGQAMLTQLVQRGIDAGEFRPCDPRYVARLMIAPVVFLTIWNRSMAVHEPAPLDDARYVETHIDLLLNGLAKH